MIFEFVAPYTGERMEGFFKFGKYECNKRLSVQIFARVQGDPQDFFEPFCSVSVNLPRREIADPDKFIFVDVNNAPWLEGFLQKNDFGMPTTRHATSGFCNYPEYFLNLKRMKYFRVDA